MPLKRQRFIYVAAFSPRLIKIGKSQTPYFRVKNMRPVYGSLFPDVVDLKRGQIIALALESTTLSETDVHHHLKKYRVDGCREWFTDSSTLRRKLRSIGVTMDKSLHPPYW